MAFALKSLCLFLVSVLCIQLITAMATQRRCQCMAFSTKPAHWKNIKEFSITQPHGRCKTEVVLTLKTINPKTGEIDKRCLDLELNQTKILQDCWSRLNNDGSRPTLKYSECR